MPAIDYATPAELFPSRRYAKSLARYRRFPSAAAAIQYIIEDVDGARFEGKSIRALYDADAYPLKRALPAVEPA